MILDGIRTRYPHLALAIYAMDPGGPVTIETYTADGRVFPFTAPTAAEALALAFPEMTAPPDAHEETVFD